MAPVVVPAVLPAAMALPVRSAVAVAAAVNQPPTLQAQSVALAVPASILMRRMEAAAAPGVARSIMHRSPAMPMAARLVYTALAEAAVAVARLLGPASVELVLPASS